MQELASKMQTTRCVRTESERINDFPEDFSPALRIEALKSILAQWTAFERWAEKRPANRLYKLGSEFQFVNYYKGSTINSDLRQYRFVL